LSQLLQRLYNATLVNFVKLYSNFTQLYKTLHNIAKLYTTLQLLQNFTHLYNTSQHLTQPHKSSQLQQQKTAQNLTNLITPYKHLQHLSSTFHSFTKTFHLCAKSLQNSTKLVQRLTQLYNTLLNSIKLDQTSQECRRLYNTCFNFFLCNSLQNCTTLYTNLHNSTTLYKTFTTHYTTLQNLTTLLYNFCNTLQNVRENCTTLL